VAQARVTITIGKMAPLRGYAGEAQEISSLGTASGFDAGRRPEKNSDFDEKNGDVVLEAPVAEDQLPPYRDHPDAEEAEAIHHPADKDDILTHTIHVEDDPTLNAITFRTLFLGMPLPSKESKISGPAFSNTLEQLSFSGNIH
jgi:hypothetical protein